MVLAALGRRGGAGAGPVAAAAALAGLLLAGCGGAGAGPGLPPAAAAPRQVILYRDTVNVILAGRQLCAGERSRPGPDWQGVLTGCALAAPYAVSGAVPGLPPRLALVRAEAGATAGPLVRIDLGGDVLVFARP